MKDFWPIFFQYLVPSVLGLVAGVIGSLIAPWVQWAIEKRRERQKHRSLLVQQWREHVQFSDFDHNRYGDTASYAALRPHLKAEVREKVEKPRTAYVPNEGRGENVKRQMLLDEIARIEKEWGLV